jgi:hypothetical protein
VLAHSRVAHRAQLIIVGHCVHARQLLANAAVAALLSQPPSASRDGILIVMGILIKRAPTESGPQVTFQRGIRPAGGPGKVKVARFRRPRHQVLW